MYGNPSALEPVEKIRKAQWTVENTRETQKVVDRLNALNKALDLLDHHEAHFIVKQAIERFKKLDPKVELP